MKLYNYFFYRCYAITKNFDRVVPHWWAAALLTGIMLYLVSCLLLVSEREWLFNALDWIGKGIYSYLVTIIVLLPNFFLFIRKDQYKAIIRQFGGESRRQRVTGNILMVFFILMLVYVTYKLAPHSK